MKNRKSEFNEKRSKKLSSSFKAVSERRASQGGEFETVMKFVIPVSPVTKKNSSQIIRTKAKYDENGDLARKANCFIKPSEVYVKYEKEVKRKLPVKMNICAPINIKASYFIKKPIYSDLNNYHNALHDVLVKYDVIADDNHYIVIGTDGSRVFVDSENPRTEIEIQTKRR